MVFDQNLADIGILDERKVRERKVRKEQEELDALPKAILVTYLGSETLYLHKGRSREGRRDPYRFQPPVKLRDPKTNEFTGEVREQPIRITNPIDIKYFLLQNKSPDFKTVVDDSIPTEEAVDKKLIVGSGNPEIEGEEESEFEKMKKKTLEIEQEQAEKEAKDAEKIKKAELAKKQAEKEAKKAEKAAKTKSKAEKAAEDAEDEAKKYLEQKAKQQGGNL